MYISVWFLGLKCTAGADAGSPQLYFCVRDDDVLESSLLSRTSAIHPVLNRLQVASGAVRNLQERFIELSGFSRTLANCLEPSRTVGDCPV